MRRDRVWFAITALALPVAAYAVLFVYPTLDGFRISLFDWSGFANDMKYVGLRNFRELFSSRHFWNVVMKNTLLLVFVGGGLVLVISLAFSHLLTELRWGRRFFRSVIFFPNIINPIAASVLWMFIYDREWGLLNQGLAVLGLKSLQANWTDNSVLFWALMVAIVWMWVGFFTVILVAALDRVPAALVESARIEGATTHQIFLQIKLPLIRDTLGIVGVLWVINAMKEFGFLYSWGGGGVFPLDGQQNLAVYMYATAFGARASIYRMGYAAAMGVVLIVLVGVLVAAFWAFSGRRRLEY